MTALEASVIIPTFNRYDSLKQALLYLDQQSMPNDRFEVIVVDDGSTDETRLFNPSEISESLQIVVIRQNNMGSAAARNLGAQHSQANLLIFIDDDIWVMPDYVKSLVEIHREHKKVIGMGSLYPSYEGEGTPFSRIFTEIFNENYNYQDGNYVSFVKCTTNNLSVKRKAFFDIGMMQDIAGDGPTWWGDVDFGYRAKQSGYQFWRSSRAICYHLDYSIKDLAAYCRRNEKAAQMVVQLFQKYPEIQTALPMFRDKTPISFREDSFTTIAHKTWHAFNAWRPVQFGMEKAVTILENLVPNPFLLRPLYRWITSSYIYRGYRYGLRKSRTV
jgi:GT2 family glycosyltransferase